MIEPNKEMGDLVRNLKQLAKGVDLLVLWLDCDREGVVEDVCRRPLRLRW